jgi:hypothetical protein
LLSTIAEEDSPHNSQSFLDRAFVPEADAQTSIRWVKDKKERKLTFAWIGDTNDTEFAVACFGRPSNLGL